MRNNSSRQKGKKNSTLKYQSFEHNSLKIHDQQSLESLREKKAAHMRHGVRRICKLYCKGRPPGNLT